MKIKSASDITNLIKKLEKKFDWRVYNFGRHTKTNTSTRGFPDVFMFHVLTGYQLLIEIKYGRDELKKNQLQFWGDYYPVMRKKFTGGGVITEKNAVDFFELAVLTEANALENFERIKELLQRELEKAIKKVEGRYSA